MAQHDNIARNCKLTYAD